MPSSGDRRSLPYGRLRVNYATSGLRNDVG